MQTPYIVDKGMYGVLDLFGATVEFLTSPLEAEAGYCVMMGTMPPGVSVPLHSHPDVESFFLLSGAVHRLYQHQSRCYHSAQLPLFSPPKFVGGIITER
jgi:hypothetical protein